MFSEDARLANLLGALSLEAARLQEAVHEPVGQAGAAAAALDTIGAYPGRDEIEQLRGPLGLSQPGAVRLVERLVAAGSVDRGGSRGRHGFELRLTGAGEAVLDELLARRRAVLCELLDPLSQPERVLLAGLLEKLLAARTGHRGDLERLCRLCERRVCERCPVAPRGGVRAPAQNPTHRWLSSASIPAPRIRATAWCSRAAPAGGARRRRDRDARGQSRSSARLADIHARVCDLIREHQPAAVAIEDLYFGRNAHSAFAVGQARGVVLLSAGMAGIPCFSYTPQAVKQAVCGTGGRPRSRCSAWSARCCRCRSRRGPTTPRTRSRWRSATRTARR